MKPQVTHSAKKTTQSTTKTWVRTQGAKEKPVQIARGWVLADGDVDPPHIVKRLQDVLDNVTNPLTARRRSLPLPPLASASAADLLPRPTLTHHHRALSTLAATFHTKNQARKSTVKKKACTRHRGDQKDLREHTWLQKRLQNPTQMHYITTFRQLRAERVLLGKTFVFTSSNTHRSILDPNISFKNLLRNAARNSLEKNHKGVDKTLAGSTLGGNGFKTCPKRLPHESQNRNAFVILFTNFSP